MDPRYLLLSAMLCLTGFAQAAGETLVRCFNLPDSRKVCLYEDAWLHQHKDDFWGSGQELVDDKQQPLAFASLRILDANDQRIATLRVHRLAELNKTRLLVAGQPVFMLTEDLSAGFGSYSGPLSRPFTVGKNAFMFVQPEGSPNRYSGMVRTLKSDWKEVLDGFLLLTCRPDEKMNFYLTYARIQLIDNRWVYRERQRKGFWELESPFPDEKFFPPRLKP